MKPGAVPRTGKYGPTVDLAAGLHSLSVKVNNVSGSEQRQSIRLNWWPNGRNASAMDGASYWHSRADEPKEVASGQPVAVTENPQKRNTSPELDWVQASTPRPADDNPKSGTLVPGF